MGSTTMPDIVAKVTGTAQYPVDVDLAGMTHARVLLSPVAAAAITSIDTTEAEAAPGVVGVFTAANLPTAGRPPRDRNSAILAAGRVVWQGQPVAVVVAETEAQAADAIRMIDVVYDPTDPVVDVEAAARTDSPLVWEQTVERGEGASADIHAGATAAGGDVGAAGGNIVASNRFHRGEAAAGIAAADEIVSLTLRTQTVHQGYLEPYTVVAAPDAFDGSLVVYSSTQGLFSTRNGVAGLLGLDRDKVRVVPMTVGGGFGARYGIYEPLAGAIALGVQQPVKLSVTRSEDFASTTPAPATVSTVSAGGTREGALTVLEADILVESGAFGADLAGLVGNLFSSVYRCPNLHVVAHEVLTNKPMVGAYRAPGAPQAAYALESVIDELAQALDIDPIRFRLQNASESGDPMGDGTAWPSIGLKSVLETAAEHPIWVDRHRLSAHPTNPTNPINHGIGVAVGGWPGGTAPAAAVCRADSDGLFYLHVGSVDITGTNVSLRRIAAQELGVDPADVRVINGDSSTAPQSGPSGGSMVTYTVGTAVQEAAIDARRQILEIASSMLEAAEEDLEIVDGMVKVKGSPGAEVPVKRIAAQGSRFGGKYPPITAHGRSAITTQAPGFTVQIVEVAVDAGTGRYDVVRDVVIQDVGHAITPALIEGQMHGGVVQGLGWATQEELVYDTTGTVTTGSFSGYLLPDATQVPEIETIMIENPSPTGPLGARGVGEPPIIAGPAAVANAVRAATGARVLDLPITPDKVWEAVHGES